MQWKKGDLADHSCTYASALSNSLYTALTWGMLGLRRVLKLGAAPLRPAARGFSAASVKDAIAANEASAQAVTARISALKKELDGAKAELTLLKRARADLAVQSKSGKGLVTSWVTSRCDELQQRGGIAEEHIADLRARLTANLKSAPITAGTHTISATQGYGERTDTRAAISYKYGKSKIELVTIFGKDECSDWEDIDWRLGDNGELVANFEECKLLDLPEALQPGRLALDAWKEWESAREGEEVFETEWEDSE